MFPIKNKEIDSSLKIPNKIKIFVKIRNAIETIFEYVAFTGSRFGLPHSRMAGD